MGTRCEISPIGSYDDGRQVYAYKLTDDKGQYVSLMNIGCTIMELFVRDKAGELQDVVLGMPDFESYRRAKSVMGATVGRSANRIAGGRFVLNGKEYRLDTNERGINHLHGGNGGLHTRYWEGCVQGDKLIFSYESPNGEEGYPGTLRITQTVSFKDGRLDIKIQSVSDMDTLVNYTNHSFFNLNGQGSGSILNHKLIIKAEQYSEVDENLIPTRNVNVRGTPFDFTSFHTIGERIESDFKQISDCKGYDVNYILTGEAPAASVVGDLSGIRMDIETNAPDIQLYTGMGLSNPFMCRGKRGATYVDYGGFCLEPHAVPNAVNTDNADQVILRAGQEAEWRMVMAFSAEG